MKEYSMRFLLILSSFAIVLIATKPADAGNVSASDPSSVVTALQRLGYTAQLDTDGYGDPLIRSAARGANFLVMFYGCTSGAECQDLQFRAGFVLTNKLTSEKINEWNRTKLIGKANIDDDGDPYIRHFVAGVVDMTPASFDRLMSRWSLAFGQFLEFIDW
jgi:hypothetical protein